MYTEDTKSGKTLCETIGYKVAEGLGGNGNTKVFISKLKEGKVSLFVDTVAFGQIMPYVKNSILRGNTINLLDCKSTEFILLRNKTLLCSITKEEFVWDFKKHKSLEKFYTHLLRVSMRRIFGKQYNKGEDISILIDNVVKQEMDRIFKGTEIKSKKLVDLV